MHRPAMWPYCRIAAYVPNARRSLTPPQCAKSGMYHASAGMSHCSSSRAVEAQVDLKSNLKAIPSWRFQHRFHRFSLHLLPPCRVLTGFRNITSGRANITRVHPW